MAGIALHVCTFRACPATQHAEQLMQVRCKQASSARNWCHTLRAVREQPQVSGEAVAETQQHSRLNASAPHGSPALQSSPTTHGIQHSSAARRKPPNTTSVPKDSSHTDSSAAQAKHSPSLPLTAASHRQPSKQSTQHHRKQSAATTAAALFPRRHVVRWTPQLILYFPIGCAVAAVRMALWVILLAVDSPLLTDNAFMIHVLYAVLGIRVKWHGADKLPTSRHVIVSNHVTVGDLMVLYSLKQSYVHLITSRLPKRITEARHHRVKLRHASGETYCNLADSALHPEPVHLFPEGGMTNGQGMMKFSRGFMRFGRGLSIVPAAMRAKADFDISTHTLSSSFVANMFWFCFSPTVSLDVTVLPPMQPADGEGNGKFVERVQSVIADELSIPVTDITLAQKHALH